MYLRKTPDPGKNNNAFSQPKIMNIIIILAVDIETAPELGFYAISSNTPQCASHISTDDVYVQSTYSVSGG